MTPIVLLKAHVVNARPEPNTRRPPLFVVYAPILDAGAVTVVDDGKWLKIERGNDKPFHLSEQYAQVVEDDALIYAPYISQVTADAPGAFDCGQACVLMLLRYYNLASERLKVKALTNIVAGRTNAGALIHLAGMYKLTLERIQYADILSAVHNHQPAIALVDYRSTGITPAQNPITRKDPGLHWIVIVGEANGWYYVHDPLWLPGARGGNGGAYIALSARALRVAFRGAALSRQRRPP